MRSQTGVVMKDGSQKIRAQQFGEFGLFPVEARGFIRVTSLVIAIAARHLLAAPSCRMARENHRSQCPPAGGTLTPTSQERAAGRRPEAQGHEVATPDSFHRPDSVGSVGCTSPNTASVPHQEATMDLQ